MERHYALDKQAPGHRLALAARKVAYGESKLVASETLYPSVQTAGNQATLCFSSVGSGLGTKGGGKLKGFAVAGPGKKVVWSPVRLEGNKVVVWRERVPKPAVVRCAWADNPAGANLYNKEGLPAFAFTTEPETPRATSHL